MYEFFLFLFFLLILLLVGSIFINRKERPRAKKIINKKAALEEAISGFLESENVVEKMNFPDEERVRLEDLLETIKHKGLYQKKPVKKGSPPKTSCKAKGSTTDSTSNKVEFSVFSPKSITPSSNYFELGVWAYLSHQYAEISENEKSMGRERVLARKLGVSVQLGTTLTIKLEINGFVVQDPTDFIVWDGFASNVSFIIQVPGGIEIGAYPGKVLVSCGGITIAKIGFLISISSEEHSGYINNSNVLYYKSAFASYASEDREEVLSRIQGMKKIVPNLDIFIDVLSLRSGQNWQNKLEEHVPNKDIFYLFWSQAAAQSKWVEREWRLAFNKKGIGYIDPVPLDEPSSSPPPEELASLHFSDSYLAYIKYEQFKKNVREPTIKRLPSGSVRSPKTGEIIKIAKSYRMIRRWIKEALVDEGLLEKIYKTNELDENKNLKINQAIDTFLKMDKYK